MRDFGGTVSRNGKHIKSGCFFRSNALNKLSDNDVAKLTGECNIGTVIDLRTDIEIEEKPDVKMPGVEYIHIPVIEGSTAGISHENETDKKAALNNIPDLNELYRSIVTDPYSVGQIKKVFEVLTDDFGGKAVLWHCTEGKDRCGLVSALFLSVLDVGTEEIYNDYLLTNKASSKNAMTYSFFVFLISGSLKKAREIKQVFRAEREYLDSAFSVIDEVYSGVDSFLKNEIGITDEIKAQMKSKYLE